MARILIIDDEDIYCEELSFILTSRGHDVRTACDGPGGLQIATQFQPDILLVDWRLSGDCDGLAVAATLQASIPKLQVVPITGHSAFDLQQAAHCRIFRVLEKPFGLDEVLAAVGDALEAQTAAS